MSPKSAIAGLRIADDLELPPSITGMRMPVFAEPGAGKSVFLAVLMEELWRLRLQFVAIDPLGTGWGIKTSADGMSAGIPVPYLGGTGRYADAPLRSDGGAVVAQALVKTGASMMLNLASFSRAEQNRFVADLWNELLVLAGEAHEQGAPISLLNLVDEAGFFMPETARGTQQARAQDAGERIARQGRSLGLGFVTPTQRGQGLDKDVLGTWEVMILMRLTDRRAIDAAIAEFEHVVGHEKAREIRTSLPHLADGEAWIIAPRSLRLVRRVQIRMRETYDSTRTPVAGEKRRRAPVELAQADLSALREALAPAVADVADATAAKAAGKSGDVRPPTLVDDARVRIAEQATAAARADAERANHERDRLRAHLDAVLEAARVAATAIAAVFQLGESAADAPSTSAGPRDAPPRPKRTIVEPPRAAIAAESTGRAIAGMKAGQTRMLVQLARCDGRLTKAQLSVLANVNIRNGTFAIYLRGLVEAGFVTADSGSVSITAEGAQSAGTPVHDDPPSAAEIVAIYAPKLKAGARRILDLVLAAYPNEVSKAELSERADVNLRNGTFAIYVRSLSKVGLVDVHARGVRVSDTLFMQKAKRKR